MQEKSIRKNCFQVDVSLGIVGHCPIEKLQDLKNVIESLEYFNVIFMKTSSGKLWIKEGGDGNGNQQ